MGGFMTLSVVFNRNKDKVLVCRHAKQGMCNFIGGKANVGEEYFDAAYRELKEESGISRDMVDLQLIRCEHVSCKVPGHPECWNMYVMAGVLKSDVQLHSEKNPLLWVDVSDHKVFQYECFGHGDCWLFLNESAKVFGIDVCRSLDV